MERLSSLDAVRGICALTVAATHAVNLWLGPLLGSSNPILRVLSGLAVWSVTAFFALSGFAIALNIYRQRSSFDLQKFVVARVWRIFPPLFAAVGITLLSIGLIKGLNLYGAENFRLPGDLAQPMERVTMDWKAVPYMLTLTFNEPWHGRFLNLNAPLWSLSYEFWIYMIAGIACAGVLLKNGLALAGAVVCFAMFGLSPNPLWVTVGAVWCAGFLAGLMFASGKGYGVAFVLLAAGAAAALAEIALVGAHLLSDPYSSNSGRVLYVGVGSAMAGALYVLARRPNGRFANSAAQLAGFSYSLYLVHFPLIFLCMGALRLVLWDHGIVGHLIGAAISIGVAVAIASAVAKLFENKRAMLALASKIGRREVRA